VTVPARNEELILARGAEWLLNNPEAYIDTEDLRCKYRDRLADLGYASRSGRLSLEALKSAFVRAFPLKWLARVGCPLSSGEPCWVANIVRVSPRSRQTIRHLLFINFLGLEIEEVFNAVEPPLPFGEAPWPCLNSASRHYGSPTVKACLVKPTENGRKLAGRFECPECGFVYVRYGPDNKGADRMHRDQIPCYGDLWDGQLTNDSALESNPNGRPEA
jgi:hypothetical protein